MSLLQGLVLRTTGSWYDVQGPEGEVVSCRPAGKLRLKGYRSTNPVAVGDLVDFVVEDDGTGVIRRIEARKNCIVRKSVNLSHESHVVAAIHDDALCKEEAEQGNANGPRMRSMKHIVLLNSV